MLFLPTLFVSFISVIIIIIIIITIIMSATCHTHRYGFYYIDYAIARRNNAAQRDATGLEDSEEDDNLGLGAGDGLGGGGSGGGIGGGNGWEHKGIAVFYLGIVTDMVQLLVYFVFFIVILTHYGMPLHLIRDLYMTLRNFRTRVGDFIRYRRITSNMHKKFPNATKEDVEREPTCIVCREQMIVPDDEDSTTSDGTTAPESNGRRRQMQRNLPKTLPCGHTFHLGCLRSWLERQQSCPTCRAPVNLSSSATSRANRPPAERGRENDRQGFRERQRDVIAERDVNNGDVNVQQNENRPVAPGGQQQQQEQQQQQQQQQQPLYRRFQYNFGFNLQFGNNNNNDNNNNRANDQQAPQVQAQRTSREATSTGDARANDSSTSMSTNTAPHFSPPPPAAAPSPTMMAFYPPFALSPHHHQQQQQQQQQQYYQNLLDSNMVLKSLSESSDLMDANNIPPEQQKMIVSAAAAASAAAAKTAAALLPIVTLPELLKSPSSAHSSNVEGSDNAADVKVPRDAADLADLFERYKGVVDVGNRVLNESVKKEQQTPSSSS